MTRIRPGGPSEVQLRAASVAPLPQFHGVRLTAYGHSFGQVQSGPSSWAGALYPARLRDLLRADSSIYVNRTQSGDTMTQIAASAASTWVDGNGGVVTLMGNQNSMGQQQSQTDFKAAVRSFLTTMLGATGTPPTVVVIKDTTSTSTGYARYSPAPTDASVAQYNTWLTQVVAEFAPGWIVVADPMADGWDPATMTCPDGQHPNDRGQAHIAASVIKALLTVGYRQGQNRGVTGPVIGGGTPALTNTGAPTITGTATTGSTLTVSNGSWSATPDSYTRQWKRAGANISGATGATYVLVQADEGQAITCTVTATKAGYTSGSATSNSVTPTAAGGGGPTTYAADTFTRTAASPGVTETGGQTWTTAVKGTGTPTWATDGAVLVGTSPSVGTEGLCYVDDGQANGTLQVTLTDLELSNTGLAFRIVDIDNCWLVWADTNRYRLLRRAGGTWTTVVSGTTVPADGHVVKVVLNGNAIGVYLNGSGTAELSTSDATYATATKHGLWTSGANTAKKFDSFTHTSATS